MEPEVRAIITLNEKLLKLAAETGAELAKLKDRVKALEGRLEAAEHSIKKLDGTYPEMDSVEPRSDDR